MKSIQKNFIEGIGNTPLIKLRGPSELTGCNIYGKAEYLNPGGSIKDKEVIKAANANRTAMVFTGMRHFKH